MNHTFGRPRRTAVLIAAVALSLVTAACGSGSDGGKSDGGMTEMTFATAAKAPTPLFQNIYIAEQLGYFKDEGIKAKFVNTGGNAQVTSLLTQGRAQVGVGVPNFQVLQKADGVDLPGVNYYEYTYPSKWSLLVAPGSSITSISQLEGKRIGITQIGTADEQVMSSLLKSNGVDPKSVKFQAVGETTAGGLAMNKGSLDANLVWDTTLGSYDVAGIDYKVLLGSKDMEKVGGFFIQAQPKFLKSDRKLAVGFARAVAKATVFALANPEAAADLYLKMYPSAASGKSKQQQIADIVKTVKYRAERWTPYQGPEKLGFIQPAEFENELTFAGVADKVDDPKQFYDNSLIDEINDFDRAAVERQAKAYKISN
jgi:NitT/TauT family transport system substrate-binding protein